METRGYNNRLQLTGVEATSTNGTPLDLSYVYAQSSHNNGNITTQTNNATNGRTQDYTYDKLNRLLSAQATATSGGDCWGQSFGNNATPPTLAADALANLFYATSTMCSSPAPQFTAVTSTNRFTGTGISYDSAGDMTQDTAYTYTYDAENRIITASGTSGGPYCYTYDFQGMRVMKSHASGGSCTGSVTIDKLYWRSISGDTIAETDGSGSTTNSSYNEYVFFAGRRIAQTTYPNTVHYYFADHLGSTRAVTDATGSTCFEADYLPYGTENTPAGFTTGNPCPSNYKFTGYERDTDTAYGTSSGNDYAFARYYNLRLGRFMSGDPLGGDSSDPQSLNRYSYVGNNPVNFIDPTGQFLCGSIHVSCDPPPAPVDPGDPCDIDPSSCGVGNGSGGCEVGPCPNAMTNGYYANLHTPPPKPAAPKKLPQTPSPSSGKGVGACLLEAAKDKGASIVLDALGAIPAVGNAASATVGIVRAGIALNHAITSPSFALASGAYGAYQGISATGAVVAVDSFVGTASAGTSVGLTLADVSLGGTKAIPLAGNLVSVLTFGWDAYQAVKQYQACRPN